MLARCSSPARSSQPCIFIQLAKASNQPVLVVGFAYMPKPCPPCSYRWNSTGRRAARQHLARIGRQLQAVLAPERGRGAGDVAGEGRPLIDPAALSDPRWQRLGVVILKWTLFAALGWWLIVGPYRQALAGAPDNASMLYHQAMIDAALGDKDKAIALAEISIQKDIAAAQAGVLGVVIVSVSPETDDFSVPVTP